MVSLAIASTVVPRILFLTSWSQIKWVNIPQVKFDWLDSNNGVFTLNSARSTIFCEYTWRRWTFRSTASSSASTGLASNNSIRRMDMIMCIHKVSCSALAFNAAASCTTTTVFWLTWNLRSSNLISYNAFGLFYFFPVSARIATISLAFDLWKFMTLAFFAVFTLFTLATLVFWLSVHLCKNR